MEAMKFNSEVLNHMPYWKRYTLVDKCEELEVCFTYENNFKEYWSTLKFHKLNNGKMQVKQCIRESSFG